MKLPDGFTPARPNALAMIQKPSVVGLPCVTQMDIAAKAIDYTGSVCYECRQKAWEENPPSLSKREQRSMDRIEAVFKEQQKAILPTNEEQRVFRKKFNTFLAKIKGNDLMNFHYEQLRKKYAPPVNDLLTTEEETQ
jgi:hypothetical protein